MRRNAYIPSTYPTDTIWMTEGTCLSRGGCASTYPFDHSRIVASSWKIQDKRRRRICERSQEFRLRTARNLHPVPSPPPSIEIARIKGSKVAILLARIALQARRILSSILRKLPLRDAFVRRFTEDSTLPANASDYHRCDIRFVAFV